MTIEQETLTGLRVGVVQMKLVQGDIQRNQTCLERLVRGLHPGEINLLVLPEMWNTGFIVDDPAVVDGAYEQGVAVMRCLAETYGCAVYGSLLKAVAGGRYVNAGVWVSCDGQRVLEYDKIHLFGPGGEAEAFSGGQQRLIVHYRGWRILLSICYDLRFPVALRYTADAPYDLLVCVANWPKPRHEVWRSLLVARALENQSYVIGCNRAGDGPKGLDYPGYSMIINPKGEALASELKPINSLIKCDLDRSALVSFRAKFPVLRDADAFRLSASVDTCIVEG